MKKVVLIGDSIRMGYQDVVAQQLAAYAVVWGPHWDGYTSTSLLSNLEEALAQKADIVRVNCGLHDIIRHHDAQQNRVPLAQYCENVEQILRQFARGGPETVIWATTTPIDEEKQHKVQPFYRFQSDIEAYNAEVCGISTRLGVRVDDLCTTMGEARPEEYFTEDGVHFTEEGYRLLGETVAHAIVHEDV